MPGKKIQTMKKRRTKYNKTRKGKKSGGGSTEITHIQNRIEQLEESLKYIQNRIKQLEESLERNEDLLPKNAIVRSPSGRYGFPESKPESEYGFNTGGGVFDKYESVSNIGRDSGPYAKLNNKVVRLVNQHNENFGLNKKSTGTGNYDRLNSKRKRMSRRK